MLRSGSLAAEENTACRFQKCKYRQEAADPGDQSKDGLVGFKSGAIEKPLADKTIKQRNAHHPRCGNKPDAKDPWHFSSQAAQQIHVPRPAGMLHGTGAEKQTPFEQAMV